MNVLAYFSALLLGVKVLVNKKMKWKVILPIGIVAAIAAYCFLSLHTDKKVGMQKQKLASETPLQTEHLSDAGLPKLNVVGIDATAYDDQADAMRKAWAQYPPDSRPLNPNQWDIIEPRITPSGPRRLISSKKDDPHVANYECTLQPNINHLAVGEIGLITLLCSTFANTEGTFVEPTLVTPIVNDINFVLYTPKATKKINRTARFNDGGMNGDQEAGDKLFTLAFEPQSSDWGEVVVMVSLSILEEGGQHEYKLQSSFSVSPSAPAIFSGRVTDRLENGSLMVDVELNVSKAGRYRVYGNLKSGENYIAYSKKDLHLEQGVQTVSLHYFGKIFHDMKANDGMFAVADIRGYRFNLADNFADQTEPEREEIPPFKADYITAPYKMSNFSNEAYTALK